MITETQLPPDLRGTFSLKGFPDKTFKVSLQGSYISTDKSLQVVVQVQEGYYPVAFDPVHHPHPTAKSMPYYKDFSRVSIGVLMNEYISPRS